MAITITSGSVQNIPEGAFFTGEAYGVPEETDTVTFVYLCEATGSTATQQFSTGQYRWTLDENYADGAEFEVEVFREFHLGPFYSQVTFKKTNIDAETDQTVYTFRITAEDMDGETATQDVTIYVIDVDDTPPTITSSNSVSIVENTGTQQVVYTVTSDDSEDVLPLLTTPESYQAFNLPFTRYAFGETGRDNSDFTIDFETGEVTLGVNPNYEEKSEYIFSVVAYDRGEWRYSGHETNYSDEFFVTLTVVNVDEAGPVITSGATAQPRNENTPVDGIIYTVRATDVDNNSENPTFVFSLGVGADNSYFNIDSTTGQVRLNNSPNYAAKNQYSFSVFATDEAGNSSIEQFVTLNILFVDTFGPDITSGYIGAIVDENSGAGQGVYLATADDINGATFSLLDTTLGFSIDANSGVVTTNSDFVADYETATEQQITIVATDDLGNSTQQLITIRIRNINEATPTITSGDTSDMAPVPEETPVGTLVYTATYDLTEDVGDVTWSLADTSLGFRITQLNQYGFVQTNEDFTADFQVAQSQSFTVVATSDNGTVAQKVVTVPIGIVVEIPPKSGDEAVLGVNPDYATLLPLIASTPPGNLRDERIAKCFKFNTPLTTAEKELFDYVNYLFLDFVPTPEFLANNPSSNSDSYVGDYVGFPPGVISVSDSELPPSDIPSPDPEPDLDPNPDPDVPDPVPEPEPDPDTPSPEPDQETEVPEIIVPAPVLGATGPDPTLPLSGGAVFVSSTGKILLDADGNPLRLEDINYSANDINIRLDNIITG